jgi:prolyl-tRNA editing enzyme YbaK/EbsC (Cys-tRNA(Pro) deacylase)
VVEAAAAAGLSIEPRQFPESTRTAAEAAAAIGVGVGQIVKSLCFAVDGRVVLALVSGGNQLDEARLAAAAGGSSCARVDADAVREATGFPIGGVAPLGLSSDLDMFIDEDLLQYDVVWAAAGTPHVNFAATPTDLVRPPAGESPSCARAERAAAAGWRGRCSIAGGPPRSRTVRRVPGPRPRPSSDRPLSALPSVQARALAFAAILVAGAMGALIGYGFVNVQCRHNCATPSGVGAVVGGVFFGGGVAVVAVLTLRAMGNWKRVRAEQDAAEGNGKPAA